MTAPEIVYDENCPIGAAIEAGDFCDGGTCPECGATSALEACFSPKPESDEAEVAA